MKKIITIVMTLMIASVFSGLWAGDEAKTGDDPALTKEKARNEYRHRTKAGSEKETEAVKEEKKEENKEATKKSAKERKQTRKEVKKDSKEVKKESNQFRHRKGKGTGTYGKSGS